MVTLVQTCAGQIGGYAIPDESVNEINSVISVRSRSYTRLGHTDSIGHLFLVRTRSRGRFLVDITLPPPVTSLDFFGPDRISDEEGAFYVAKLLPHAVEGAFQEFSYLASLAPRASPSPSGKDRIWVAFSGTLSKQGLFRLDLLTQVAEHDRYERVRITHG